MKAVAYSNEKGPFAASGDLEDESYLNEVLMDSFEKEAEELEGGDLTDNRGSNDDIVDDLG